MISGRGRLSALAAFSLLLGLAPSAAAAPIGLDAAVPAAEEPQEIACAAVAFSQRQWNRRQGPVVSRCTPPSASHEGFRRISWVLDPEEPVPGPAARSVVVAVHEMNCAGGRNPIPYLQRPEVRYLEQTVVITFWIEVIDGPATCPSNPVGRLKVKLPGPLGARQLYDGSTDPPRKVEPGEAPSPLPIW
jgi:hypothetical protein